MRAVAAAALLAFAGFAGPALAGIPVEEEMTCPVGGESFTHTTTGSYSTYGARPDGKPYGSWVFPMPLPECPGNRLVLYKQFDDAEIETLSELVGSDAYRAMEGETDYYRAQWLEDRLSNTVPMPWLLMRATWQVDGDPDRRRRYLGEFADRAASVAVDRGDFGTMMLRFRLANAQRELGALDRAAGTLAELAEGLDPAAADTADEAENLLWFGYMIDDLSAVVAAGDTSIEPLAMLPVDIVKGLCAGERKGEAGCRTGKRSRIEAQRRAEADKLHAQKDKAQPDADSEDVMEVEAEILS